MSSSDFEHTGKERASPAAGAAERVRQIIASAESIAASLQRQAEEDAAAVRVDAEREAQREIERGRRRADELVAERRRQLDELSGELAARAESVIEGLGRAATIRAQLEELVEALAMTAERVASEARPDSAVPAGPYAVEAPEPLGNAPSGLDPQPQVEGEIDRDDALLVALQMAVAGCERREVEQHLRDRLAIPDPEPIVSRVFSGVGPARPVE